MRLLGIDPDTKNTGMALVEFGGDKPVVVWAGSAMVREKDPVATRIIDMIAEMSGIIYELELPWFTVIEGQVKYPNDNVRPNDLINLAQVAGAAAGLLQRHPRGNARFTIVKPHTWKGSVPKPIHQKRTLKKVLIQYDGAVEIFNKIQQGHITDAIGLALWGYENLP